MEFLNHNHAGSVGITSFENISPCIFTSRLNNGMIDENTIGINSVIKLPVNIPVPKIRNINSERTLSNHGVNLKQLVNDDDGERNGEPSKKRNRKIVFVDGVKNRKINNGEKHGCKKPEDQVHKKRIGSINLFKNVMFDDTSKVNVGAGHENHHQQSIGEIMHKKIPCVNLTKSQLARPNATVSQQNVTVVVENNVDQYHHSKTASTCNGVIKYGQHFKGPSFYENTQTCPSKEYISQNQIPISILVDGEIVSDKEYGQFKCRDDKSNQCCNKNGPFPVDSVTAATTNPVVGTSNINYTASAGVDAIDTTAPIFNIKMSTRVACDVTTNRTSFCTPANNTGIDNNNSTRMSGTHETGNNTNTNTNTNNSTITNNRIQSKVSCYDFSDATFKDPNICLDSSTIENAISLAQIQVGLIHQPVIRGRHKLTDRLKPVQNINIHAPVVPFPNKVDTPKNRPIESLFNVNAKCSRMGWDIANDSFSKGKTDFFLCDEISEEDIWCCPVIGCDMICFSHQAFVLHLYNHLYYKQHTCSKCNLIFEHSEQLLHHFKLEHSLNNINTCVFLKTSLDVAYPDRSAFMNRIGACSNLREISKQLEMDMINRGICQLNH